MISSKRITPLQIIIEMLRVCHLSYTFLNGLSPSMTSNKFLGQLLPRKIAPWIIVPQTIVSEEYSPPPRITAPWIIAPGLLLLDNYSKDNWPPTISP